MDTPAANAPVATPALHGYGGFTLGGMALALPMSALREVVPRGALLPLPSAATGVLGAIDLRGVLVPVLDLRRLLQGTPAGEGGCVIVMVHDGHLLGLLADDVSAVYEPEGLTRHDIRVNDGGAALLVASLRHRDGGALVSLLSPEALAALPGVPRVADPEPEREGGLRAGTDNPADDDWRPLMLARCGELVLGVDALVVHGTLADPQVLDSPLAMGLCRGVVETLGQRVPVVDLLELLGLGRLPADQPAQAFVVRHPQGLAAYLVSEVLDVVRVHGPQFVPVPAFAVARPDLVPLSVSADALTAEVRERLQAAGCARQVLVLPREPLTAEPTMSALAEAAHSARTGAGPRTPAGVPAAGAGPAHDATRPMLIYQLNGGDTATPIDQVSEILPFRVETSVFDCRASARLGLRIERGRAIPLLCLSRLMGGQAPQATDLASVLVVEQEGDSLGFVVPALRSIEAAAWEPELPSHALASASGAVARDRRLAQVGEGAERRLLPMLDLQGLARTLREGGAARHLM